MSNNTYDMLPNITVNLSQVRSNEANLQVPFNAIVFCKCETGPIGEITPVYSYNEAVSKFGLGTARTPVLYGVEQVLRSYGFLNIVRLAATDAEFGTIEINLAKSDGTPYEPAIKVLSARTDYKTDLFNGDEIKLHYDSARTRMSIKGTLNGVSYSTPLEIIDLSTATADVVEASLTRLVNIWNELGTGVTLTNEYTNKTDDDQSIKADDIVVGTMQLGNSGNTTPIENDDVIELFKLIEDPKFTKQDVVVCPEFRNYEVVNAGIALKNKYFYVCCADGATVENKSDNISQYTISDQGVCYTPSKCIMADPDITVPFECAVLYAWANSYSDSRYKAPAGTNRAVLEIVTDLVDNLSDEDAEILYNNTIPCNPVKYISGYGFTLYGQKTMDSSQEFTNRINVSGLVNYITIEGKNLLNPYIFEYTPIGTFQKVSMDLSKLLDTLVTQDVIYNDYKVICDSSNNTDETLFKHELHVAVAIRPINVTEYIILDLTVTDQLGGAE